VVGICDYMSTVIWVMGLSGSGKTSVAKNVVEKLRKLNSIVVHLDGDDLRDALQQRENYDQSERVKLAMSYARLSQLIANQGPIVVVSSIGLYSKVQLWLRENIEHYVEVLLDAPFELLLIRDKRGIYSRDPVSSGPVVGKDFPPEFPTCPDLHIFLNESVTIDSCGDRVLQKFFTGKVEVS
jgi:cytidine diphosphoramidate kinase